MCRACLAAAVPTTALVAAFLRSIPVRPRSPLLALGASDSLPSPPISGRTSARGCSGTSVQAVRLTGNGLIATTHPILLSPGLRLPVELRVTRLRCHTTTLPLFAQPAECVWPVRLAGAFTQSALGRCVQEYVHPGSHAGPSKPAIFVLRHCLWYRRLIVIAFRGRVMISHRGSGPWLPGYYRRRPSVS